MKNKEPLICETNNPDVLEFAKQALIDLSDESDKDYIRYSDISYVELHGDKRTNSYAYLKIKYTFNGAPRPASQIIPLRAIDNLVSIIEDKYHLKGIIYKNTEKPEETLDKNIKPEYYSKGKEDLISFLKDHNNPEEFKGFMLGNAMKYLTRLGKKDDELQDLDKAIEYLKRYRKFLTDKQKRDKLKKLNTHI